MSDERTPFLKGVFSLYETPEGGYHLAWRADGETEDQHIPVPPLMVKMARQRLEGGGGSMLSMFNALRKGA